MVQVTTLTGRTLLVNFMQVGRKHINDWTSSHVQTINELSQAQEWPYMSLCPCVCVYIYKSQPAALTPPMAYAGSVSGEYIVCVVLTFYIDLRNLPYPSLCAVLYWT